MDVCSITQSSVSETVCAVQKHSLRLPSMSAWLFRVSTPCLYVTAFRSMGMAMKGLLPSVTLATRLLPPSHCSSTSSDRLFLSSSSSLHTQTSVLFSLWTTNSSIHTFSLKEKKNHKRNRNKYSHSPLKLLILYRVIQDLCGQSRKKKNSKHAGFSFPFLFFTQALLEYMIYFNSERGGPYL